MRTVQYYNLEWLEALGLFSVDEFISKTLFGWQYAWSSEIKYLCRDEDGWHIVDNISHQNKFRSPPKQLTDMIREYQEESGIDFGMNI